VAKSFLALAAFGGAAFSWMCVPHSDAPPTPPATSSPQQTRAVNVTKLYNDY
jgi:hypothetical protein